jgi:hypothetical protein
MPNRTDGSGSAIPAVPARITRSYPTCPPSPREYAPNKSSMPPAGRAALDAGRPWADVRSVRGSVSGDSLRDRNSTAYGAPCIRRPLERSSRSIKPESSTSGSCPRIRYSTFALELRRSWRGRKRHLSAITRWQKPRGAVSDRSSTPICKRSAVDGRYKELDVHAQVAADALAVRHHAAEALLRLACATAGPGTDNRTALPMGGDCDRTSPDRGRHHSPERQRERAESGRTNASGTDPVRRIGGGPQQR